MTTDRSMIFVVGDAIFRCIPTTAGRYEWHADDGQCVIGCNVGKGGYWARCGALLVGGQYRTHKAAMVAAVTFKQLRMAA